MERPELKNPLQSGTKLGPYTIVDLIGAGGMGSVWKAEDTRLHRLVAIKTCDERFSERFEREAKAIAALNHPHICSLYDVAPEYLVMEYVDGKMLSGPMPLDRALAVADQILDALDAAHRKGIVHRDLKPANILLSRNGVKVLDFGLAKMSHGGATAAPSEATRAVASLTVQGSILGTVPYMSPEQIEGQEVDARSDIFSFGVILYELITGKRPFSGKSQSSLIASILREQPQPLHDLVPLTPASLDRVVQTCLEKDPDKRWQSARELKHALTWIAAEKPSAQSGAKPLRPWQGAAALLAVVALGLAGWTLWPEAPGSFSMREVLLPENGAGTDTIALSPDGLKLVTIAGGLWIRDLDELEWRELPGTSGASTVIWSPDSRHLVFAAEDQLRRIDTTGGPPETLGTVEDVARDASEVVARAGGTWNEDGVLLLGSWGGGSGGPIWRISDSGGTASALTQLDASSGELYHTWPTFLPDGEHFLYFRSGPQETQGIYVGSLEAEPENQPRQRILATPFPAVYANGYVFFLREAALLAQPFDAGRLQLEEDVEPVVVAEAVATTWYLTGTFTVSPSGVLAYRLPSLGDATQLTWFDRQGNTLGTVGEQGTDSLPRLSPSPPDGSLAVVKDAPYGLSGDLWTLDSASGRRTRLTYRRSAFSPGVWSPDGTRIAYAGGNLGDTIYQTASSGEGDPTVLLHEPGLRHYPTSWSADDRFLLYHTENSVNTGYDVWVLPLEGNRKPVLLAGGGFNEWAAVFSPDTRWVAYVSMERGNGRGEVFVRQFNVSEVTGAPGLAGTNLQVSSAGGNWPIWPSQSEILFWDGGSIFAVPVDATSAALAHGDQVQLFNAAMAGSDATPDGQRFLSAVLTEQTAAPNALRMMLNWPAGMRQ